MKVLCMKCGRNYQKHSLYHSCPKCHSRIYQEAEPSWPLWISLTIALGLIALLVLAYIL